MKPRMQSNPSRLSTSLRLLAASFMFLFAGQASADVGVNLNLWRGYNNFYGQVTMTATNPAPITYHRVESPNGLIWRVFGPATNNGSFANLGYAGLIDECTNGLWSLTLNEGDPSESNYTFSVATPGVSSNLFGDITMIDPLDGATVLSNPPNIQWSTTSLLPEVLIVVEENNFPYTYGDSALLPGTTTNWTPSVPLSTAEQSIYMQYVSNNFTGITFTVPTNLVGGATAPGWTASADLMSYLYSSFNLPGGGSEIDQAVESPGFTWTTGGDFGGSDWFVQTNVTSVGTSAIQSGPVPDYATSWIETTIQGPGSVYFEWNMLADDGDYFDLTVSNQFYEGEEFSALGDEAGSWDYYEVILEPGPNTLRWTFHNEENFAGYMDAAFLDGFEYYPVVDYQADFELNIQRVTRGTNDYYVMFPFLANTFPEPVTTHEVASPNWSSTGSDSSSSSAQYDTLQDLITEIEGGDWTLNFNFDGPGAREYYFTVTVDALTTNDLPTVTILEPLDGATGVATNTAYSWTGPTHFDTLVVYARDLEPSSSLGFANLPVVDTNWPGGPTLPEGTNSFDASYTSNNFAGLTISEPMDWDYNYLDSWSSTVEISTRGHARFVAGSGVVPLPVTLLPPMIIGGDFGLSFLSQSGATHSVQSTTNLVDGPWIPVTNFPGNGTTNLLMLPATNTAAFYRIETQ